MAQRHVRVVAPLIAAFLIGLWFARAAILVSLTQ
jgi:hypothetical protein